MRYYGIELEFFVRNNLGVIVPAYNATSNLDGNPILGELRTSIHHNIVDCVFELKKLIYNETKALKDKGYDLELISEVKVDDAFIKELRRSTEYTDRKSSEVLKDFSIYGKQTGKVLPKGVFKASLQLNISENEELSVKEYSKIEIGTAVKWDYEYIKKKYSQVFNFVDIIRKLDKMFEKDIKITKRVSGVYAIKDGQYGKRIEYRSLPNNIQLDKLLSL